MRALRRNYVNLFFSFQDVSFVSHTGEWGHIGYKRRERSMRHPWIKVYRIRISLSMVTRSMMWWLLLHREEEADDVCLQSVGTSTRNVL